MANGKTPTNPVDLVVVGTILSWIGAAAAVFVAYEGGLLAFAVAFLLGGIGAVVLAIGIVGQGVKMGLDYQAWVRPAERRSSGDSRPSS